MNKKDLKALNERFAKFEFENGEVVETIQDGLYVQGSTGERNYFKPLYTDSFDSCLPLLEKLGDSFIFNINYDTDFSGNEYICRVYKPIFESSPLIDIGGSTMLEVLTEAIDKAINELSKSEGK